MNGEMLVSPGPTPEAGPCGLGESRHPGRQSISGETEPDPKQYTSASIINVSLTRSPLLVFP